MTLQEAKDQIAKKYTVDLYNLTVWMSDEAAELYSRSKWDEACKAQREECYHQVINHHTPEAAWNAPQPEFKP